MTQHTVKIYVSGTVQGVGFRYFTHRQALKLSLHGYVRNLNDGRVEIVAQGNSEQIEQLKTWLVNGGPTYARVTTMDCQDINDNTVYDAFSIRH